MGRKRLLLNDLDLAAGDGVQEVDWAEELANRILESFDLDVSDEQFEVMCEVIEGVALDKRGEVKDHRPLTAVCVRVGQAKLSDDVRTAMLLVLLKDRFKKMRGRIAKVATQEEG